MVLQGKGGVGKTLVASMLAQTLKENGHSVVALDLDPVNSTFAGFAGLGAEAVSVLVGDKLDGGAMDGIIERMLDEDANFVVDNGASGFLPISSYLLTDKIHGLLSDAGKRLVVHSVIVGGMAMADTVSAIADLAGKFDGAELVLWSNPFFGDVDAFFDGPWWQQNEGIWAGVVHIPDPIKRHQEPIHGRH